MKVLIIGAGSIGLRHAEILSKMNLDVTFLSKRSDLSKPTIKNFSDVTFNDFDYFVISNETSNHYETLKKLIGFVNNKKILIENPLFMRNDCLDIKDNECYIGYNLRFHPIIQEIKSLLLVEHIISIELNCGQFLPDWNTWRDYRETYSAKRDLGGGVLKDLTHEIDLLYFFIESEVSERHSDIYRKISDLDIETNDFYRSNGFIGKSYFSIGLDYISRIPRRNIVIYTNNNTIIADLIESNIVICNQGEKKNKKVYSKKNSTYEKLHKAILFNDGKDVCNFKEGLRILKWFKD